MFRWHALYDAMRTSRTSRIGPDHAEQLLAGGSGAPDHAGLARLLSAAAAPARPHELAGEQAMVAAFIRARREPAPRVQPPRTRGVRTPRYGRMAAVAAGLALAVAGGTAFAAETGNLPGPAQRRAHDLFSGWGVPAPSTGAGRGDATTRPFSAAASGDASTPDRSELVGLCRDWVTAHRNPHAPALPAADLRTLAAAAGDPAAIPTYCERLLADDGSGSPATPDGPSSGPSHPGKGPGNGKGKGGTTRPEPSPNTARTHR
jgi:hypothetical protein